MKLTNKILIKKYPWLRLRNVWSDKFIEGIDFTWLDDVPCGWKKTFGLRMIKELDKLLRKANYQDKYRITEIKEKYGSLHWYDNGVPVTIRKEYDKWHENYENLSENTCIKCGKPAKIINYHGWYQPLCKKCQKKLDKKWNASIKH